MPRLPVLSGEEVIKVLSKLGFKARKGSHVVLQRADDYRNISVPLHKKLKAGTLRAIIKQAGLTVEEFMELL